MRSRWARLCLAAIFLAASACAARANTLTVTSVPPGATVEINGLAVGTTPLRYKMPGAYFHKPAGAHAIKIQSRGKKGSERQLEVLKDSKVTLSATLDPQT